MSKKIIQSIVIILGIFIILAFLALIYGMYLKLSTSSKNLSNYENKFNLSANLSEKEKLRILEVIDKNKLLITIENSQKVRGAIYDINKNKLFVKLINKILIFVSYKIRKNIYG